MKPERWHEIERLYRLARDQEPQERETFLKEACAGKESLRKEIESLIACRPQAETFIESPAIKAAARILAEYQPAGPSGGDAGLHKPSADAPMQSGRQRGLPPWWILLLSLPFAACAGFLYFRLFFGPEAAGWTLMPVKRVGSETHYLVTNVPPQSAAARAGIQDGDLIFPKDPDQFIIEPHPTTQHRFEIERGGEGGNRTLTLKGKGREYWLGHEGVRALQLGVNSVLYLILAGILVVARPQDTQARWGALLLAQLGIQMLMLGSHGYSLGFMLESGHALRALPILLGLAILVGMSISVTVPAGAFGFLAGFPQTPITGRRAWSLIWVPALVTIPIDLKLFWLPVYEGASGPVVPTWLIAPGWVLGAGYLAASIVFLMRNYHRIRGSNERRRLRMVVAGFGITIFAMAVAVVFGIPCGPIERFRSAYFDGSYFDRARPLLFAAAPICTAYAILRHRMFDIHMMVRLGLRYAAARGLLLSIVPATGLVLALDLLIHRNEPLTDIIRRRGLLYAMIALGAFLLHARQKVWLDALDRRFFREHYDAQRILSALVDDIRRAGTFDQAASHAISQVEGALHPEFASLMVCKPGAASYHATAWACDAPRPIPSHSKLIALMQLLDKPLENSQSQPGGLQQQLPRDEVEYLRQTRVEWLFPVSPGGSGTGAILLLGPKRSEEPYSREDLELLCAITGSLALLLERSSWPMKSQGGFGECPECGNCYDSGLALCETDGARLSTFPYSRTLAQRYRFERRLGRGGMGSVYQARDTELERHVAVKVIRSESMAGAEAVARFRREAKAAAGFSHPNVVTVHDFGVAEDGRAYLVMELLSGCSLREELLRCGRFDSKRVLEILRGVSMAVAAAHERMLLHRDLKPENIFLTRTGQAEVAKILDFGLAKRMTPGGMTESVSGTAPGMLIGTLPYMSPEQIRDGIPMESWDLWALAVVAFEMITGVHPFGKSVDWRTVLIEDRFPPLNVNAPALTQQLRAFFERSLSVDRSRRPASARHVIAELQAAL